MKNLFFGSKNSFLPPPSKICAIAALNFFSFSMIFAQEQTPSLIYGTPDEYQGYFVFNKNANENIENFKVEVYRSVEIDDSTHLQLIGSQTTRNGEQYMRLNEQFYPLETENLTFKTQGINNDGQAIAEDEWIEHALYPATTWASVCSAVCNGSTYTYKLDILEEVNYHNGTPTNNPNSILRVDPSPNIFTAISNGYYSTYRYMSENEWSSLKSNSELPNGQFNNPLFSYWNRFEHYGFTFQDFNNYNSQNNPIQNPQHDGVKTMEVTSNAVAGEYKNKDGNWIIGKVFAVKKDMGQYTPLRGINKVIPNWSETICGNLISQNNQQQITNFTLYANNSFNLSDISGYPDLNIDLNQLIVDDVVNGVEQLAPLLLSCDSYHVNINNGTYDWSDNMHLTIPYKIPGVTGSSSVYVDVFEYMEEVFRHNLELDNNTGIDWWPSDEIKKIQIYRIKETSSENEYHGPITIHRDSLFNSNGTPENFNFSLNKGLYSLVVHGDSNFIHPFIFETTSEIENSNPLKNYADITVYPVPFDDNGFTTSFKSDVFLRVTYTVYDDNATLYHTEELSIHPNQELTVNLSSEGMKSGAIFHKFEFEDQSNIIKTTLKE